MQTKKHWIAYALCVALGGLTLSSAPNVEAQTAAKPADSKAKKGPRSKEIAKRVQTFYDKTKTFQAGFKQRYWIKKYNKYKNSNGQVVFEKPGKMSWRYKNNGNRVVSDGKKIKVYEAEEKQMYEQDIDKSQYPAALAFLTGGGSLRKAFRLRKLDSKRMKFEGGYVLLGKPRKPTPAYTKVLFYIDGKTNQVRRVMLIDAEGNRNTFDFLSPSVNKKTPKGEFDFKPPAGTKVIKP
ncbi:MAG: outer membrane lipoprotein carrier protein LolA [Myxococcales bacterium]|nr:outer membrane lipoprotein carrier protein LolA [Myxococcales bacterium]